MFQTNRSNESKQVVTNIIVIYILIDWVKNSIQLYEKCKMSEKLVTLEEDSSFTCMTVNHLELKNTMNGGRDNEIGKPSCLEIKINEYV